MKVCELVKVNKVYGVKDNRVTALRDVNFSIEKGEIVIVTGPSGGGKSSLLSIVGLIDADFDGQYFLLDTDVNTLHPSQRAEFRNKNIGYVFQEFNLINDMTVFDNIMVPLKLAGKEISQEVRASCSKILERVGLKDTENRYPHQLSGGQQQRVAIARALINSPQFIIADEPTGNLDTKTGDEIIQLFKELNDSGVTILMVTHNENFSGIGRNVKLIDGRVV